MIEGVTYPHLRLSEFDELVYRKVVPEDHFLRKAAAVIDWKKLEERLAGYYCPDKGRPAEPPVLMLKLEYLRYHYNLSDRQVIQRATTDLALRQFLEYPLEGNLPHPTSLCVFRDRLGVKGFREIFTELIQSAREQGIVKDRLRIKDASHVLANIDVPSSLELVAQTRDKLLAAAEPFAAVLVGGERVKLEFLRESTRELTPSERLVTRVVLLKDILAWADELPPPENAEHNRAWRMFVARRDLAHKILADQEHPKAKDRTLSTIDPDARCGNHGGWFNGYYLDVLIDPDSELVTQINVLPGNVYEALDAPELLRQEHQAYGNTVEALSIDGAGFKGPLLRELEDEMGIETYVPAPRETPGTEPQLFQPQDFQEDKERGVVTCPAGQTSQSHFYDKKKETTKYRFDANTCRSCPLLSRCMKEPPKRHGRTVCKSDYQAEHERARQKTRTPEYAAVRRQHGKVERKLGEILNRHGGRRACYWGLGKIFIQECMATMATNVKRLVYLMGSQCAQNTQLACEQ